MFGIALFALLVTATTILAVLPSRASASSLSQQLRDSRREVRRSEARFDAAKAALATAIDADVGRGLGTYVRDVEKGRDAVRYWKAVVRQLLAKQAQLSATAKAAGSGDWKTLIDRAAKKYGISAKGLYRLMMMESGGKVRAIGAGRYYGLFQYAMVTWKDDWNPWRGQSVYDGVAQINASAYAIKKGKGPSLWGNTYPAAF
jgi:soluble lytic murein transglycosylase-like protein